MKGVGYLGGGEKKHLNDLIHLPTAENYLNDVGNP